jgi:hypothetical protein
MGNISRQNLLFLNKQARLYRLALIHFSNFESRLASFFCSLLSKTDFLKNKMNQPLPGVPNTGSPFFLVYLQNGEIKSLFK